MRLAVDNIVLERGGRVIVDGLSFEAGAGEAVVITGPNGAGKTTLLRSIAGFLAPVAGAIRLDGGRPEREIAEQCHFVGHRDGVKGSLTVLENALFWARFLGGATGGGPTRGTAAVQAALERVGIAALADVPAAWLSAGQRRRLGLARLLLAVRPLWLLDEPTVSLDAAGVEALAAVAGGHLREGGIVVAATHIPLGLAGARDVRLGSGRMAPPDTSKPES